MRRLNLYSLQKLTLFLALMSVFYGCSDKGALNFDDGSLGIVKPIGDASDVNIDLNSDVTYELLKSTVLESKCIGCHNDNRARGGVDLSTYEAVMSASTENGKVVVENDSASSTIYLEAFNGTMPPRTPLTEEEIALIKKWIDTGANKGGDIIVPSDPSDSIGPEVNFKTLDANYINLKKYILEDKCIGCHKKDRAKAEVDLSSYETIFGMSFYFSTITEPGMPEQSALYTEVFNGNMPPRKKLSDEEIEFIRRWIAEGAIE